MLLDNNLAFSSAQAITATAASYVYDQLTGQMLSSTTFTPGPAAIIGNETYYGEDLGVGQGVGTPRVVVTTGTTNAATGTSLQIAFQGAPDNVTAHASGLLSDLTFVTYMETDAILTALLLKNTLIASFDWPKRQTGKALPRFVRLDYVVGGSNFTSLTVSANITLAAADAVDTLPLYPNNYAVSA